MRKSKMVRMLGMDLLVSSCSSTIPALRERGELSPTALEFSSLLGFFYIYSPVFYIYLPSYASIPPKLILCDFPGDGRARDCSGIVQSPFLEIFVSPFILLYLPIIISCQAASVWLPWWRKRKGRTQGSPAREWILSTDQVHRQLPEKGKAGSLPGEELLTRFPPVANIIRFVRPSLFPKQCKGYMAPNNQLYGPIDVKHDCDTNNIWWKQNDEESLMQMLKSYLWQARPAMHNGNGAALKTYRWAFVEQKIFWDFLWRLNSGEYGKLPAQTE